MKTHDSPCALGDRDGMSVYLVDDDDDLREELVLGLADEGICASGYADAADFYRAFIAARCDIVVIDIPRGGESGLSLVANLRAQVDTGILVLSSADAVGARLQSFECGADACLVKPIDVRELAAQLRVIHRRMTGAWRPAASEPRGSWALKEGGWVLRDPGGNELPLTTAERTFLLCLLRVPGQPVSRDELISSLGSNPRYADPHRIDVLVNRLRSKATRSQMTLPLHSVRCKGYVLTVDLGAARVDDRNGTSMRSSATAQRLNLSGLAGRSDAPAFAEGNVRPYAFDA